MPRLPLLPSGPGGVHRCPLREARPSSRLRYPTIDQTRLHPGRFRLLARPLLAAALAVIGAVPAAASTSRDNVRATLHWNVTPAQVRASCSREIARAKRRIDAVIAAHTARTAGSL